METEFYPRQIAFSLMILKLKKNINSSSMIIFFNEIGPNLVAKASRSNYM